MMRVVLAAVNFAAGSASASAVVSYHAGAAPISVITTRIAFTVLALWVFIRLTGGATGLAQREERQTHGLAHRARCGGRAEAAPQRRHRHRGRDRQRAPE